MSARIFNCIDAHTCGNPVRLVVEGGPDLQGRNMSEKRQHFLKNFDWIRKGLMFEPRGHDMMSGSIIYPPHDPENDIAVLFIETSGCLPMCGHGTIGTVTIAVQEGLVKPRQPGRLKIEVPAGTVEVEYEQEGNRVRSVRFRNVASYLALENIEVNTPIGRLTFDVAYGGNFYAIIDPQDNYPGLGNCRAEELITWSREIRKSINENREFVHPEDPTISGLSHVMWTGEPLIEGSTSRNAVFYGDKAIDRSPCGTGTSARMAQWYAKGKLKQGEPFIHESIIGSRFTGRIESGTDVGSFKGIIPSIEGWAMVTGYNRIIIDDQDPYAHGFQVI